MQNIKVMYLKIGKFINWFDEQLGKNMFSFLVTGTIFLLPFFLLAILLATVFNVNEYLAATPVVAGIVFTWWTTTYARKKYQEELRRENLDNSRLPDADIPADDAR